jgi:hypothetical protein
MWLLVSHLPLLSKQRLQKVLLKPITVEYVPSSPIKGYLSSSAVFTALINVQGNLPTNQCG